MVRQTLMLLLRSARAGKALGQAGSEGLLYTPAAKQGAWLRLALSTGPFSAEEPRVFSLALGPTLCNRS